MFSVDWPSYVLVLLDECSPAENINGVGLTLALVRRLHLGLDVCCAISGLGHSTVQSISGDVAPESVRRTLLSLKSNPAVASSATENVAVDPS